MRVLVPAAVTAIAESVETLVGDFAHRREFGLPFPGAALVNAIDWSALQPHPATKSLKFPGREAAETLWTFGYSKARSPSLPRQISTPEPAF